jgi:hypothetical protein
VQADLLRKGQDENQPAGQLSARKIDFMGCSNTTFQAVSLISIWKM